VSSVRASKVTSDRDRSNRDTTQVLRHEKCV
jgi:hypothetical protein